MNVTGAIAKFNPKLEPLIKTAQKFKTNEHSNDLDQISFAPASHRNLMNQTQINARAVNTSFSNPFSTNLNQTRSPGGSVSPKQNWADLQSEIQIIRPDPKGDKMKIEIDKCSVFQN